MIQLEPATISMLIYVAIFVGVLLAFEGVRQLVFRDETKGEARNRRMQMIERGATTDDVLQLLRDPALLAAGGSKGGPVVRLRRLLVHAGFSFGLFGYFLITLIVGAVVFAAASQYLAPRHAIFAAFASALLLPYVAMLYLKAERTKKLTSQLPDALDLMSRALKVGHPISVTIGSVASDMPDPIGTEFGIIQDQISYGDDVATAFRDFAERVGTEDAEYLAVSIGIQHGTGGNLSRILEVLAKVIRDRFTMRKKIKAISAEGRLSGIILTALPILIYLSVELTTPSYYGDVRGDPLFPMFAYTILGLIVAQGFILFRLVKFKF